MHAFSSSVLLALAAAVMAASAVAPMAPGNANVGGASKLERRSPAPERVIHEIDTVHGNHVHHSQHVDNIHSSRRHGGFRHLVRRAPAPERVIHEIDTVHGNHVHRSQHVDNIHSSRGHGLGGFRHLVRRSPQWGFAGQQLPYNRFGAVQQPFYPGYPGYTNGAMMGGMPFNGEHEHHHHHIEEAAAANADASDAVTERASAKSKGSKLVRRGLFHGLAHGIHEEHDREHHPHGHAPPYAGYDDFDRYDRFDRHGGFSDNYRGW